MKQYDSGLSYFNKLMIDFATREGIAADLVDEALHFVKYTKNNVTYTCYESLCDNVSSLAFLNCNDKSVTSKLLSNSGLLVPAEISISSIGERETAFLEFYKNVVVKPAIGEQGLGVTVNIQDLQSLQAAFEQAKTICEKVILQEYVQGDEMRILIIDNKVAASTLKIAPHTLADGIMNIMELFQKFYSEKKSSDAASQINLEFDADVLRCIKGQGYEITSIPAQDTKVYFRYNANIATGGRSIDNTEALGSQVCDACERASEILRIPVVGFDIIKNDKLIYFIEANERPGLGFHEPQPVLDIFFSYLFKNNQ